MPTITPQGRPIISASTEDSFRQPLKKITAAPTGMTPLTPPEPKADQTNIPVETPAKEVTLSPQMTALARKEAKFRQQEQEFKKREVEFAAKQAEADAHAQLKAKLAAKDFSVLDELGVSYEEWTNYLLSKGEGEKPEVQAVKKLEEKVSTMEKQQAENLNKQYEATLNQYRGEIKAAVEASPDTYESVKALGLEEHVLNHIVETFNEDGKALTVAEALKDVEEFMTEEALKMAKLKKVQSKLAPPVEEKKLPAPKPGMKTLTQQAVQGTSSTPPKNQFQHLTAAERLQKAIERSKRQG